MRKVNYPFAIVGFILTFSLISVIGQKSPTPTTKTAKSDAAVSDYSLLIENEDGKQIKLSFAEIGKIKRQTVKVNDHGEEATFDGYALVEVLKLAGIEFGESLRGKRLATFLLIEAADKYQVVFALPELDPAFTDKLVLLADRRDGQPLSKTEGQLRLVVPDEKKHGRWVRQITNMKILRAANTNK